ncbi:hypothetical protein KF728_20325 [Candidatus Obscuribacterales bacterium]|nr:hypothetical protein [Candidatus Obscuribacterales bacterium]MBX3152516.1 hypothetical protein [Candidatus Obscuribacterales bacterium]
MMPRNLFFIISAVLLIVAAVLGFMNISTAVALNLFGATVSTTVGTLVLIGFALGLASAASFNATRAIKDAKSEQNQLTWQKQDEKLAKEIQSDKEKQLEAKIQTLEIALKSALDKAKKKSEA